MKRLLITGGSGFLGWHCGLYSKTDWRIYSSYFSNKNGRHDPSSIQLDLTDKDETWRIVKQVKPDAVFHLAAHSGTGFCEKNPEEAKALNVDATATLAEMAADIKARFLFTSSEQVFDGEAGNYTEIDSPRPRNEYGKQKLEAEQKLKEILPEACIVRIAVLFGRETPASKCFLNQWADSWDKMVPVTTFYDEIRPFLSADNCSNALFHLLNQGAEGIFHLGGSIPISRADFAELAKGILGFDAGSINAVSQKEVETDAFRPSDLSLDCKKIKSTGFSLLSPEEELRRLKPFFENRSSPLLN